MYDKVLCVKICAYDTKNKIHMIPRVHKQHTLDDTYGRALSYMIK